MNKTMLKKGFTLVELLVVITILAILSVTAYQSFGGATDKAQNTTKKANVTLLGNTLGIFYTEKNYYPMPQDYSTSNVWGYNSGTTAQISNTIRVTYNDQEVNTFVSGEGGGRIHGIGTATAEQIGAKGVIGTNGKFNKKYLKEKVYDTQLGDIKLTGETDKKMIDYGIGKFVYGVYSRPATPSNWNVSGNRGTYYTLAATFKDIEGEGYKTFTIGNYSQDNFESNTSNYPEELLGLKQDQLDNNVATTVADQGIPYPIDNFAK